MDSMKLVVKEKQELFKKLNSIIDILQMTASSPGKMLFTSKELSKELGVSRNQLYMWRKQGKIKSYGRGKTIWYLREDVIDFVKTYRNEVADKASSD